MPISTWKIESTESYRRVAQSAQADETHHILSKKSFLLSLVLPKRETIGFRLKQAQGGLRGTVYSLFEEVLYIDYPTYYGKKAHYLKRKCHSTTSARSQQSAGRI